LLQPLQEGRVARLSDRIVRSNSDEHTDPPHPLRLLRMRGKRTSDCGAGE
jgi:hypothetical protein